MKFPPFIILEGPDASGKSTLAEVFAHRLKGVVLHAASMGDDLHRLDNELIMSRYHCNLIDIARRNLALGRAVICDRLWLSHIVYTRAKLQGTMASKSFWEARAIYETEFATACASMGATYIFTLDPSCVENHEKHRDPEHPYSKELMLNVLTEYTKVFGQWRARGQRAQRYDYSTDGRDPQAYIDNLQKTGLL